MKSRLIIFTRYPVPGQTKTRLIPTLGEEGASELHREMTEFTVQNISGLSEHNINIQIRYTGGNQSEMEQWLGEDLVYVDQGDSDLGQRMERCFRESFDEGYSKTVIIGTDCPSLGSADVEEAFALLEDNSVVLGPAVDGGYYLIGIRASAPEIVFSAVFEEIPWGTSEVLSLTLNALAETGIDLGLLDDKDDVDEPGDLVHWEQVQSKIQHPKSKIEKISVIIPVLNEEERIRQMIEGLSKTNAEIVVVDGGSTDGTVRVCKEHDVAIVSSPPGRATQMNAGAAEANGDVFIFLHVDTRLPGNFVELIREATAGAVIAGAFSFGTDMNTPAMGFIEWAANFRSHRFGIVFGDQAIFATKGAFLASGGFPDQPVMEDYAFWRKLKRLGKRTIIPEVAETSARKWSRHGLWRVTWINHAVTWGYLLGVPPEKLARWYNGKIGK